MNFIFSNKYCVFRFMGIYEKIGLKHPEYDLSDDDIECCLYLLSNINVIVENLNK